MMKTATLSACCAVALIGILALTTAVPVDRDAVPDNQFQDEIIAKIDSIRKGSLDILRAKRDVSQLGETEVIGLRLIKDTPEDVYRFLNQRANLLEEERRKRQACNCSLAAHSAQAYGGQGGHQIPLSLQFTTTVDVVGENLFQQPQYQGQSSQYELSQGQNAQSQYDQYAIIDGPTPEPLGLAVPLEKVPARKSSVGRAQAQSQSGAIQFDQLSFVNGPIPQPLGLAVPLEQVPARNPSASRAQAQVQSGVNQFDQFSIINGPIPKPLGLAVPLEKVPARPSSVSATSQASGYHALLRGPLQTSVQEAALSYLLTTQTQRRFFNVNYNYNLALAYQTQLEIQKNSLARRSVVTNPNGISCADVCDCAGAGFGTLGICTPKYCQCDPNTQQPLNFKCEGDQVFDPFNLRCDYPANIALCSDAAGAVVHDESTVGSQTSLSSGGSIVFDEQSNAAGADTHGSHAASAAVHGDSTIENHGGFSMGNRVVADGQSQAGVVAEAHGSYAHQSYSHQNVQQGGSTEQHASSIQFPVDQQTHHDAAAVKQHASGQVQHSNGQTNSNAYDSTSQAAVEQPTNYDYSAQTTTGDAQAQSGHSAQVHSTVQYDGTASQSAQAQVSSPAGGAIQFNEDNQNGGGQAYDQSYVQIESAQQSGYDQSSQGASGQQAAFDGQAAEGQQATYDYSGQSASEQQSAYDQSNAQPAVEQQSAYDHSSAQAAAEQQSAYDQSYAKAAEQQSAYDQTAAQVATEQQSAYDQSSVQPSSDQQSSYDYSSAQVSGSQQYDQSTQVQSAQQAEYDQSIQAQTVQESGYEQPAQVIQQESNYGAVEHSAGAAGQISATITNHGENHNGAQNQVVQQQQVTQQSYEQIPAQVVSVQQYEYTAQEGQGGLSQSQQAAQVDSQQYAAVDNGAYESQQAVSGNQASVATAAQGDAYGSSTGQSAHVQSAGQHSVGSHSGTVVHQEVGHSAGAAYQVSHAGAVTQGASHSPGSAAHQASHSGGAVQLVAHSGGAAQQISHSAAQQGSHSAAQQGSHSAAQQGSHSAAQQVSHSAAQQVSHAGSHHQSSGVGNLGHQQASHSAVVYTPTVHGSTQSLSSHQGSAVHSSGSAFHRLGSYAGSPINAGDIQVVVLQPQQGLQGTVIQTYQQPAIASQVYTSGYQIAPVVSAGQTSDAVVIDAGSSIQQLVGQNVGQATRLQAGLPENYDVGVVVLSSDSTGAVRTPAIFQTPDSVVVQSTANNIAGHSATSGHQGENGYAYNTPSIKYSESSAGAQRTGHSYSSTSFQSNYGRSVSSSSPGGNEAWVWKSGQPKQIQTNSIHHYA